MVRWTREDLDVNALALAANAVVVAHKVTPPRGSKEPLRWVLSALTRDSGETLWDVELPGEPLMEGLALARDGAIVVPLLDGRVLVTGE